jgi:hypothetical protein
MEEAQHIMADLVVVDIMVVDPVIMAAAAAVVQVLPIQQRLL